MQQFGAEIKSVLTVLVGVASRACCADPGFTAAPGFPAHMSQDLLVRILQFYRIIQNSWICLGNTACTERSSKTAKSLVYNSPVEDTLGLCRCRQSSMTKSNFILVNR